MKGKAQRAMAGTSRFHSFDRSSKIRTRILPSAAFRADIWRAEAGRWSFIHNHLEEIVASIVR